jgi:hypothetical protein
MRNDLKRPLSDNCATIISSYPEFELIQTWTHMEISIALDAAGLSDSAISHASRELLRDIKINVDPTAALKTAPSIAGSKSGPAEIVGQILLALVSGGSIAKLSESFFSLSREKSKIYS